jgi:dephospho-CoA kinase
MYCVGLTGNIASGKSTAIEYFKVLGAGVILADDIAKKLTRSGEPAFFIIKNHFGEQVINQDGELNRSLLRQLIFSDANQRIWLENLLHPLIKKEIVAEISFCKNPYCVIEIPLLKNRKDYPYLDNILVISAGFERETERLMKRDSCKQTDALAIMAAQPSELLRRQLADDLIINDGSVEKLNIIIKKLHSKYLHFALKKSS